MRTALVAIALAACLGMGTAAEARSFCKDRSEITRILLNKYKEVQSYYALQSDGMMLEIFTSAKGAWTALVTTPNRRSCVVASGEGWTVVEPMPAGEPA